MVYSCLACNKTFTKSQALSLHRNSCKKATLTTVSLLQKRKANQEHKTAAKIARKEALNIAAAREDQENEWEDASDSVVPAETKEPSHLNIPSTTSGRARRFPKRYDDYVPSLPTPIPYVPQRAIPHSLPVHSPSEEPLDESILSQTDLASSLQNYNILTEPNEFGLYRAYTTIPSYDPYEGFESMCDSSEFSISQATDTRNWLSGFRSQVSKLCDSLHNNVYAPFLNVTVFRLMNWFYNSSNQKSIADLDRLVNNVILPDDFDKAHLEGFSARRELNRLDNNQQKPEFSLDDGWHKTSVKIRLPADKVCYETEADAPELEVTGLYYRKLLDVLKTAWSEPAASHFHLFPFKLFWKASEHSDDPPVRVLPDFVQDTYGRIYKKSATAAVLTHLKRELLHEIWLLLLDPEFMHAYEHGIVLRCSDGNLRRVFPRFFTYSADYPEKIILASIKSLGKCPCPRCFVKKDQIGALGMKLDQKRRENGRVDDSARQGKIKMARQWIFEKGYAVASKAVERLLGPMSLVPTRNAFSTHFSKFNFNFYSMFMPDLLHEFELGVWKAILTHLLRILYAAGGDSIQKLNQRFRQVPTFGRDTICKFSNNVSGMKKLAGRDFEDLLQCSIPVFEGLLPSPHNEIILDLLFTLATWHAYAKLRLHTETTLGFFDTTTTSLGQLIRRFSTTVYSAFITQELPQEEAARGRRIAALAARSEGSGPVRQQAAGTKQKFFNMSTYKLHALGDYIKTIRLFGTTDNYTTQVGELEHRRVKRFYARTNKNQFQMQVTKHERRERLLEQIRRRSESFHNQGASSSSPVPTIRAAALRFEDADPLPHTSPRVHYHVSESTKHFENVTLWVRQNLNDPALKNFRAGLQNHLLARLLGKQFDGDEHMFSDEDRNCISFVHNRIYRHKVLCINYMSYDMRRCQDSINPRTYADIIVLSHEDNDDGEPHPYWYARVVGIFHAEVRHTGPFSKSTETQRMDFLFVRWFGWDLSHRAGWNAQHLYCVGFLDSNLPGAFSFLDPNEIIRAVHTISTFAHKRMDALLPSTSIAHPHTSLGDKSTTEWRFYYIGIFVVPIKEELEEGFERGGNTDGTQDEDLADDWQDEEIDYGYVLDEEVEEEVVMEDEGHINEGMNDLGPEDGEDNWGDDADILDLEGFGAL
ncbi:hypothetical protein EW146_g1980 [Bondarzewia mesenterica]|uniref:C2H2-type domain-containing protein n=1 Tax=Bondarzewia mesenterica TaxID=1095465 RepID=A0A4S4M8C4_9AGAM|nr:hypothetical protein EW146_g1980 [Bondarzewia mesenterica]